MLQSIRDRSQGWLSIIIIGFLIVMFALWGISYYLSDSVSSVQTLAKVNGKPVTVNDFRKLYGKLRNQNAPLINSGKLSIDALKKTAVNDLIQREVTYQAVQNAGLGATNASIDQYIYTLPALQENGKFSEAMYKRYLQMQGLTTEGLRLQLKEYLLLDQWRLGLLSSDFILPGELKTYLGLINQKRMINYVDVTFDQFSPKIPTEQQISAYYNTHKNEFIAPEKVKLAYLSLTMAPFMKNAKVTDAQAQAYYDAHKASYTTPSKRHVAMILLPNDEKTIHKVVKALSKGASFSSIAKQYSQDPISAKKGGDIGWISPRAQDVVLAGAVFGLSKVGQMSKPFKTKYGTQIIKLLAIKPAATQPFADVKNDIIKRLEKTEAMKSYAAMGNQLANITYENPSSLTQAAKQLNLKVQTTAWVTKKGAKTGILSDAAVLKAAFSDNVLNQKNNSDPINITDEHVVVIRDVGHVPEHLKKLEQVKDQVIAKLKLASQVAQAKESATKLRQALEKTGHLTKAKSDAVSLSTQPQTFAKAVFNLPRPLAGKPVSTLVKMEKAYRVVHLERITMPSSVDPTAKVELESLFERTMETSLYKQFVDSHLHSAKIDYNQKVKESL